MFQKMVDGKVLNVAIFILNSKAHFLARSSGNLGWFISGNTYIKPIISTTSISWVQLKKHRIEIYYCSKNG
jgi:hypothetical protein